MPPRPLTRLRKLCLALPEAHEVEAWGEPTFRRLVEAALVAEKPRKAGGTFAVLGSGVVWMCFFFFLLAAVGRAHYAAPNRQTRRYHVDLDVGAERRQRAQRVRGE